MKPQNHTNHKKLLNKETQTKTQLFLVINNIFVLFKVERVKFEEKNIQQKLIQNNQQNQARRLTSLNLETKYIRFVRKGCVIFCAQILADFFNEFLKIFWKL